MLNFKAKNADKKVETLNNYTRKFTEVFLSSESIFIAFKSND